MTGALSSLRQKLLVQCGALGVLLPLSYLLARPLLEGLDWGAVHHALGQIGLVNWAIAIAATIGSFAALGRYDVVVHRHLGTRQPERAVQLSGAAAVGLAQFLGLGLITGTIARWRALPGLGAARAGAVTALVSVSFLLAWLGLFGAAGLILPHSIPMPPYVFAACLISALLLVLYTCLRRTIGVGGARIRLPSLYALGAMAGFAALDTALAGLAFWVLIPAGADITYAAFLPIYLAGLGIALISNTPGGVGPFELTLLWALQDTDLSSVLAGLIAFRLLYFAAPAVIAGIYLAVLPSREPPAPARSPRVLRTPQAALHPEAQVAAQGGAILTEAASGVPLAPVRRTGQVTVSLFDPPCGFDRLRPALVRSANAYANWPLAYKISAQSAFKARRAGWSVLRIADDAIIDTARWSTQGRAYATLRRKLRKAASASLTITYTAPHSEPSQRFWQDLARIDAAWCAHAGGARGFSMGRFDPAYLSQQHLCVAWQDGAPVAFASFHCTSDTWALDLMRHIKQAPDGTMHALVASGIETAAAQSVASVSLAAIPVAPPGLLGRLTRKRIAEAKGLIQFKHSFAPQWTPLYAAAPHKAALLIGLWDIWQSIMSPDANDDGKQAKDPHNQDDNYEFASQ